MKANKPKAYRHGDVILTQISTQATIKMRKTKRSDTVLAYGEVTGHSHRFVAGQVTVWDLFNSSVVEIKSETGTLDHEEHGRMIIPKGTYRVRIQRRYDPVNERATVLD